MTVSSAPGVEVTLPVTIGRGWHHVAASFDDLSEGLDEVTLFLDGSRLGTALGFESLASNSIFDLGVGGGFNGWLDEARISDTLRYSATSSTYPVPTAPFVDDASTRALWHFDDAVAGGKACATTFGDASGTATR